MGFRPVSVIYISSKFNQHFSKVANSTNFYLCKNKDAAADFGILKDICEQHLEQFDNEIDNLINLPLYLGLGVLLLELFLDYLE